MSAPGGQGVSASMGGGLLWGGDVVVVSQHALRQAPPVNRITDTSKNITLARTSLRPVITENSKVWNNPWWTDPGKNLKRF